MSASASRLVAAANLYALLRAFKLTDDLAYDGEYTVTVAGIRCYVTDGDVVVRFPDLYGDPDTDPEVTVRIGPSHLYTAMATIVEGLLLAVKPTAAVSSTSEAPHCCGRPMHENGGLLRPGPSRSTDTTFYHCDVCDRYAMVEITDRTDRAQRTGLRWPTGGDRP